MEGVLVVFGLGAFLIIFYVPTSCLTAGEVYYGLALLRVKAGEVLALMSLLAGFS